MPLSVTSLGLWIMALILPLPLAAAASPPPAKIASQAVIRLEGPIFHPRINSKASLLAFTDAAGRSLRVLDLKTHEVLEITPHRVGPAFFWSPDGVRLFYRELLKKDQSVESRLQAFDAHLNQSSSLELVEGSSGYLTYSPYQQTAYLLHEKGILAKRLDFPGQRLATWQKKKPEFEGQWVASQSAILWLTDMGLTLKKMEDDGSGIESFAISPDGNAIAWATIKGNIYTAQTKNPESKLLDQGRDPSWHPYRSLLVYSAARLIGANTYDFDLKLSDLQSQGRFVASTPGLAERWPIWLDADTILHTAAGSTDLLQVQLKPQSNVAKAEGSVSPAQ